MFIRCIVRDTTQTHGIGATFITKPFPDLDGSGLHIHLNIRDDQGRSIFDDGGPLAHLLWGTSGRVLWPIQTKCS